MKDISACDMDIGIRGLLLFLWPWMFMNDLLILKNLNLFIFAKDKKFRYLYCNEIFAEVAGLDSPSQIQNKTDNDLFWHKQADFFNAGDRLVLSGGTFVNTLETQLQPKKIARILTTKTLLKSQSGKLLGLVGSYIDVSDYTIKKITVILTTTVKRFI
jgi:PAS domain-containing protein